MKIHTSIDYQMNKTFHTFLYLCLCFTLSVNGQAKNEIEVRIDKKEFPKLAQDLILSLPNNIKRLKLYKETDGNENSYEAKFKLNRKHYSVEFSENGLIEDIEITIKFSAIEPTKKTNIKNYFKNSYSKHEVIKTQEQYVHDKSSNSKVFLDAVLRQNTYVLPNFEIIAEVKQNKKRTIREFTFNATGSLIYFRILDNTSYEHVLY